MSKHPKEDEYSEQETVARREDALKRMLSTPPKPHSEMKLDKRKAKASPRGRPPKKMKRARQQNRAPKVNRLLTVAWRVQPMAEISFDSQALGISTLDDQSADVSGPMSAYAIPMMVRRKFIGETAQEIVCLSNIYRIPGAYGRRFAEDVDSGKGEVCRPNPIQMSRGRG